MKTRAMKDARPMMTRAISIGGAAAAAMAMAMAIVMLLASAAGNARAQGELFNPARIAGAATSDPAKIVDLTYSFDASTIYWPTEGGFEHKFEKFGMQPGGYFYSSARFAAVSNPTKSKTPYRTPKKMPDHPWLDDDGLNGAQVLWLPSFTMTMMKKPRTTRNETSARPSWARVEIRTPV